MDGPIKLSDLFDATGPGRTELEELAKAIAALSRNVRALGSTFDKDAQRIGAGIAAVVASGQGIQTQLAGLSRANEQERASAAALVSELTKLAQQRLALNQAQAGQATTQRAAQQATQAFTAELRELRDALKQAYADNSIAGVTKAAIEIQRLKTQADDLNRALRGANSTFTAAQGSYRALENEARQLDAQLKALAGGMQADSKETQQMKARLAEVNQAMITFGREVNNGYANVGRYVESIMEAVGALEKQRAALLRDAEALRTQARATGLSAEQQEKLQQEIKQTEAELGKVNGQLRQYGVGVQKSGGFTAGLTNNLGGLAQSFAGAYYGIQGLATALKQAFDNLVTFSDQLSDVRKTTGLSADEADRLADSLKKIDTRTSLSALLDIAKVGGQLGIAKNDILGFTKAIDIANQALGDDFKGNAEQIATELGKIGLVFQKQFAGQEVEEKLLNIGSALNELGAVGAATAPQLADVALRVGATAANAGVSLPKVLGMAAALEELGFSAEVSGTALNRIINTLTTRTGAAFKIAKLADANLTLKEFKRLLNTDMDAALNLFLKGLNSGNTSTTAFSAKLASLKLQSGEAKSVLTALAKNTELVAERQATANEQLRIGTSLTAEAKIKNETLAGSYEKLKNGIVNLFTEGAIGGFFKGVIDEQLSRLRLLESAIERVKGAANFVKDKLGIAAPAPERDFAADAGSATKTLYQQAQAAEKLLKRYYELNAITSRTAAQQAELGKIILAVQRSEGAGAVQIDKATQAVTLNTEAVKKSVLAKFDQANANKQALADQLAYFDGTVLPSVEKQIARVQQAVSKAQLAVSGSGIGADKVAEVRAALQEREGLREQFGQQTQSTALLAFSGNEVRTVEALTTAEKGLALAEADLKKQQAQRASIAAALLTLTKLNTDAGKDAIPPIDDSIEADKKKKQSVADLKKEEYELAKQRLQNRISDLDRQADNPGNSEAVQTDASRKGTEARKQLAVLERNELIREAAKTYKDQINGAQATATARLRISEQFRNATLEIERSGDKKLLELRNALLNQLGELDRLQLETEAQALDKVVGDENKSYQERQQAALDAAARRIEAAEIAAAGQIRAARGNALAEKQIYEQLEKEKQGLLSGVRSNNADFKNDELDNRYLASQIALEKSRAAGILTERQYYDEAKRLETDYHDLKLKNLQDDPTKQKEAAQQELDNLKQANADKIEAEKEFQQERQRIVEAGFSALQTFSDAFFTIGNDQRAAELSNLQHAKEQEVSVAGENAALKSQIEEKYRAKELAARRKQAQYDKAQALFNVALNTAAAVTSVLSTGGGTAYADFGVSAAILSAIVIAQGVAQAVAIAAKPLPSYFKGRTGGPAELARVAEQGPELVGQPGTFRVVTMEAVTRLAQNDNVFSAPRTAQLLRDHDLIAGRLVQRQQQADLVGQTRQLQATAPGGRALHEALAVAATTQTASRLDADRIVAASDRIVKAVESQEQLRITEGELRRFKRQGDTVVEHLNKRYRNRG